MNFAQTKFIFVCFLICSFWSPVSFSMTAKETKAQAEVYKKQTNGAWKEFRTTLINSTLGGLCAGCISCLSPLGTGVTAGAALSGFAYYYSNDLSNALAYLRLIHKTSNLELAEYLNKLELEFARQQEKLTDYNQKKLSSLIMEARTLIGYGIRPMYVADRMYPQSLLKKIEQILQLPTEMSKPCHKKQTFKELAFYLKNFSDPVADAIMKAANQILLLGDNPSKNSSRAAFIFIGEAGVGKTTTVEKLAKLLGRPYFRMTLADTTMEQLYGTASKDPMKGKGGRLGHLARFLTTPGTGEKALDPIIFIDEVHHAFNSSDERKNLLAALFKDLNDENIEKIHDNSLDVDIDIRKAVFILGSNIELPPELNALASRLTRIYFTAKTKEEKKDIADENFSSLCERYGYFPSEDDQIEDKKVIANIIARDASPGVRVLLKVLEAYIIHKLTSNDPDISLRCTEFNIDESIRNHCGQIEEN